MTTTVLLFFVPSLPQASCQDDGLWEVDNALHEDVFPLDLEGSAEERVLFEVNSIADLYGPHVKSSARDLRQSIPFMKLLKALNENPTSQASACNEDDKDFNLESSGFDTDDNLEDSFPQSREAYFETRPDDADMQMESLGSAIELNDESAMMASDSVLEGSSLQRLAEEFNDLEPRANIAGVSSDLREGVEAADHDGGVANFHSQQRLVEKLNDLEPSIDIASIFSDLREGNEAADSDDGVTNSHSQRDEKEGISSESHHPLLPVSLVQPTAESISVESKNGPDNKEAVQKHHVNPLATGHKRVPNSHRENSLGGSTSSKNQAKRHSLLSTSSQHDVRLHSNATSAFTSASQTIEPNRQQREDNNLSNETVPADDKRSGGTLASVKMLLKAIYYDGVLSLSVPFRLATMMVLALCVAGLFYVWKAKLADKIVLGVNGNFSSQGRNRYTHKGRVVYEWKDTPETAVLYTKLPKGLTAKSLDIKIWSRHVKMGRIGKQSFIREELFGSVVVDQCTWEVLGDELVVTLQKDGNVSWPCVFKAHHPDPHPQQDTSLL